MSIGKFSLVGANGPGPRMGTGSDSGVESVNFVAEESVLEVEPRVSLSKSEADGVWTRMDSRLNPNSLVTDGKCFTLGGRERSLSRDEAGSKAGFVG